MLRPAWKAVVRSYDVARLKLDVAGLERTRDDVCRELGRQAAGALRRHGTLSADEVAGILRRFDDVEDRIAQKACRIAEIEREDAPERGDATGS